MNKKKVKKRPKCERLDCFACDAGKCTALDKASPQNCHFYQTKSGHRRGVRRSFYRLVAQNRLDLILKYWGTRADFGPYIKDVEIPDPVEFDTEKYRAQMRKAMGSSLSACPVCSKYDCCANIDGHCIVLEEKPERCPFYQASSDWYLGVVKSFYRIAARERFDLIDRYRDTLWNLGLFRSSLDKARRRQDGLDRYRQETLVIISQADNPSECAKALRPKETDFLPLEMPPKKKSKSASKEAVTAEKTEDEYEYDEDETAEDTEDVADDETAESEPHDAGGFDIVPEDINEADKQLQGIAEYIGGWEEDTVTEEREISEVNEAEGIGSGSTQDLREKFSQIHEENRFAKENAGRVFRIEDFYRPTLLRSQALKKRPDYDWTYGMLAAEVLLLTARDYVRALRDQLLHPEDPGNTINVLKSENYFGSRDYWQLTNLNPEKVKERCMEIAINQEKAAILKDNARIVVTQREHDDPKTEQG